MRPGGRARARRRLLALGIGVLAAFGLLEGGLWIGYAFARPEPVFEMGPLGEGSRTILCIGDSNTYGINLPRKQSYPGQLQAFLDRWPENPWRVVNAGYPGHNSAQVRARLARHLEEYQPEITICLAGVNNSWSLAERHLWRVPDREVGPSLLERLLQGARVVKMARLAANSTLTKIREPRIGAEVVAARVGRTLRTDYRRIRDICGEHGAQLLISDYPIHLEFTERAVNAVLWELAGELGIPIVPLHGQVLPAAYGIGYGRAMFPDFHARALGNHEVARSMLLALMESGMLESRPEWTSIPPLHELLEDAPILVAGHDAERARVVLSGPPGARYRILLARLYARGQNKTHNVSVPHAQYRRWSDEELASRGFTGVLDGEGRARPELLLPPEPETHPELPGAEGVWLGWRLHVRYEPATGGTVEAPPSSVDVLLDPALGLPGTLQGGE